MRPDSGHSHYNLGVALDRLGRHDEAATAYRETLRLEPDNIPALVNLTNTLSNQGNGEEAIALYRKAVAFNPDLAENHSNFGNLLRRQGNLDEAVVEYREAIRLLPYYPAPYNNLAWLLSTSDDPKWRQPDEAVHLAAEAVKLKPGFAGFWDTLGLAHYRNCEWREAIKAIEKSVELAKDDSSARWLILAMAQWRLGENCEAIMSYDEASCLMENYPLDEGIERLRVEAVGLLPVEEADEAIALREEAVEQRKATLGWEHRKTLAGMCHLADAYRRADSLDEAAMLFERVLKLRTATLGPEHPDSLDVMTRLISVYHAAGRLDDELSLLEQTIRLKLTVLGPTHPESVSSILNLVLSDHLRDPGFADERRKMLKFGLDLYRSLLDDEGDDPETLRKAAEAFRRVNDIRPEIGNFPYEAEMTHRAAISVLEKLTNLCADDPQNHHLLAVTHLKRGQALGSLCQAEERETALRLCAG